MDINFKSKETGGISRNQNSSRVGRLAIFSVLIVIMVGVWYFWKGGSLPLATHGYQAVFLTNGQVYFGKLESAHGWLVLNDIYYLQASESLQQTATPTDNKNVQLVKLGTELHGPEDAMFIERDKVLFWENLKEDSKVVEAIKKDKPD